MSDQTLPERLLRPKEAAEILQLSQVQVYRLVRQGELPAVIIGKSVRFRADQLSDFVDEHNKNLKRKVVGE
jgi:excisionase family DNA binding protein